MKKTESIMFQGTCSNAGKSVLTASLCRILLQDGVRVAPFKAQNMSLNSFVTRDGREMGRAQVVQAQAARLDPDVRMNPVLLKPASGVGCQVIVNGRPIGNQTVDQYIDYKRIAWDAVRRAYDSLATEYDCIILEGAGSPAEVNLKHHDIVNMKMAEYAEAPVLLVGDIDRGGVFASFVGTMEIFDLWERDLVAAYVVNKFRGDAAQLAGAYDYMHKRTGKPVVGTIPYVTGLGLPEEDSVSFKSGLLDYGPPEGDHVVIGLIDLPHLSNFTDIEPFFAEPDVHVRILKSIADTVGQNRLDAIIIPGSKNVIFDLTYLQETGFADYLKECAKQSDIEIVGICGGYQMLGKTIADPHGLESKGESVVGLGLLDFDTELKPEKTLTRVEVRHIQSGLPVHGYEIHHGESHSAGIELFMHDNGHKSGSATGLVCGFYLHGIFDADAFRRWFIDRLRVRKGLAPMGKIMATYDLEPSLDRLAEVVRNHIDMNFIYSLIGL